MKVGAAIAAILKREGVEILARYPVNHLIEFAAAIDIRPVRPEPPPAPDRRGRCARVGAGEDEGVGIEPVLRHGERFSADCAYGGVAQAFGDSIPILVVPGGYAR